MAEIEHGGNLANAVAAYGGSASDWIDISTGISPFPAKIPQIDIEDWRRLPEANASRKLEQTAQRFYQTDMPCIATPGSQFTINILPKLLTGKVGIVGPTYGEYSNAFMREGLEFIPLKNIENLNDAQSVILANPNNPNGRLYSTKELCDLSKRLEIRGGMLVVDEAFCDMFENASMLGFYSTAPNLIVLKSIGKFFGLAGARVGFVFCSETLQHKIKEYLGPWPISAPSLSVANHVLSQPDIRAIMSEQINHRFEKMHASLRDTSLSIIGQTPLFFLVSHPYAADLHAHFLTNHILTRKFDYKTDWLRLGLTRDEREDQRVCQAIKSFGR